MYTDISSYPGLYLFVSEFEEFEQIKEKNQHKII